MSENISINLTGWKVLVIIPVFILIIIIRIATINNMESNSKLLEKVNFELMTEFYPDEVDKMKSLYESGDVEEFSRSVKSVTTAKININTIKASYKIFNFSSKTKEVVVKVDYSIDDEYGTQRKGENYYRFEYKPMINGWHCLGKSSSVFYYLNFI